MKETDLFDRGYGDSGVDFLKENRVFQGNTITNPPYSFINDWILKSLEITSERIINGQASYINYYTMGKYLLDNYPKEYILELAKNKVYIFGRIQTIETIGRYNRIFKHNKPVWICPFVKRIKCYPNGDITNRGSAVCYAWFIWDNRIDNKDTKVKWLI